MLKLLIIIIIIDNINAYSIQECNNTSIETATNDDYLLKDEFKCYNDGICIQINYNSTSFEQICNCRPGYTGKQCTKLMQACNSNPCGSNGYCNSDPDDNLGGYFCRCKPGFRGAQCKENINDCLHAKCYNDGICVDGINSYECKCKWPYNGRYCQTKQTCNTTTTTICKNNGVCIQNNNNNNNNDDDIKCVCSNEFTGVDCSTPLINNNSNNVCVSQQQQQPCLNNGICKNTHNNTYECECNSNYYGKNCEFETPQPAQNNGSFVLIVNINKNEFERRKFEIIKEFEKKYGILMLIKQDEQTKTEMIYEFKKSWCKIYFIIIFACLTSNNNETRTICLQNNINDLSDSVEILNEIKKTQLPNYVSNISYEAAGIKQQPINSQTSTSSNTITISTTVLAFLGILLLIGISLSLTVLIKQQNIKRIKAPIWYPPAAAVTSSSNEEQIYEKVKSVPKWSINKAFDDFTHLFTSPSSSSSSSDTSTNDLIVNPPVKIRKLDLNTTNLDYPSPPESLPETTTTTTTNTNILNPINFKGGFHAITPLMVYIMGRSKMLKTQYNNNSNSNDLNIITTFCTNGADLNAKNLDGETALHLASRCGLIEIVKSLLLNGADPSLFDNYGRNVLHTAVSSNEYEIVKLILNHCISFQTSSTNQNEDNLNDNNFDDKYDLIDSKTNDDLGDTPLIIASRLNLNKIVKLLIDFSASVNATDNDGRSALHWCSKCNNLTGACILIQSGANVNMQDNDEKTPLSSALNEFSSKLMADLLIKFDAFVSQDDELKYNKMKYILDNNNILFTTTTTANSNDLIINNVDAIKHDLINKIKNEPNIFTSSTKSKITNINNNNTLQRNNSMKIITTSTKRKLSDTLNNQSENKKHTSNKTLNKQQQQQDAMYTPLTPSPPIINHQYNNNLYQQQHNQEQSSNSIYYTHQQDLTNLTYGGYYDYNNSNNAYINQQQQQQSFIVSNNNNQLQHQQLQCNATTNSTNTNNNNNNNYNLFNSNFNETYAAYF